MTVNDSHRVHVARATTRLSLLTKRFVGWQYAQLAAFFPLFLLVLPYLKHDLLLKAALTLLLLNSLLVADAARPAARALRRIGWLLWGVSTAALLIDELGVDQAGVATWRLVGLSAYTVLIAICAAGILTVLFRAGRVTLDGIFASIVAYELIGLFFAQIYTMLMIANPATLRLPDGMAASGATVQLEMIYFSFVTLATLGYGDIVPAGSLPRALTIIEAVSGQFYVAVVVAVLVSAFVAQRLADIENTRDSTND